MAKTPAELGKDDTWFIKRVWHIDMTKCGSQDGMRLLKIKAARDEGLSPAEVKDLLRMLESKRRGRPKITKHQSREVEEKEKSEEPSTPTGRKAILRRHLTVIEEAYRGERQAGVSLKDAYSNVGSLFNINWETVKQYCASHHREGNARFRASDLGAFIETGLLPDGLREALGDLR
jgi:hypothetical protein